MRWVFEELYGSDGLDSRFLTPWTRQQARMGWCLIAVGLLLHMLLVISLMGSPLDRVGLLGRWD